MKYLVCRKEGKAEIVLAKSFLMNKRKPKKLKAKAPSKKDFLIIPEAIEPKKFEVVLTIGDKKYPTKADTIIESLETIYKDSEGKVKTWGVFNIKSEGKKAELKLFPLQVKRALGNKVAREIFAKRLLMNLK